MIEQDRQSHSVNIIYDGTMEDLLTYLFSIDVDYEFIPPGLANSSGVLVINPEVDTNE